MVFIYIWGVLNLIYLMKFKKKSWMAYCILGLALTIIGGATYTVYTQDKLALGLIILGCASISYGFLNMEKKIES